MASRKSVLSIFGISRLSRHKKAIIVKAEENLRKVIVSASPSRFLTKMETVLMSNAEVAMAALPSRMAALKFVRL